MAKRIYQLLPVEAKASLLSAKIRRVNARNKVQIYASEFQCLMRFNNSYKARKSSTTPIPKQLAGKQ